MYYDLLVHADLADEQRFKMALTNINFYRAGLPDETYTVVLLANAGAVRFLVRDGNVHAETLGELSRAGVKFKACANALRLQGIEKESLLEFVEVVPAGVVEIVRLQREGFAYVKP